MSEAPAKKKGGARPGAGRKKLERPPVPDLDGRSTVGRNVAQKVLDKAKAEDTWLELIDLEKRRLGLAPGARAEGGKIDSGDYQGKFSIIPLTNLLRYLEDRAYGRPMDTVNHLHDKPIEMNVNVKLSEIIRGIRERKQKYERRGK